MLLPSATLAVASIGSVVAQIADGDVYPICIGMVCAGVVATILSFIDVWRDEKKAGRCSRPRPSSGAPRRPHRD